MNGNSHAPWSWWIDAAEAYRDLMVAAWRAGHGPTEEQKKRLSDVLVDLLGECQRE